MQNSKSPRTSVGKLNKALPSPIQVLSTSKSPSLPSRNSSLQKEWKEEYNYDDHPASEETTLSFEPNPSTADHGTCLAQAAEKSHTPDDQSNTRQSRGHRRSVTDILSFRRSRSNSRSSETGSVKKDVVAEFMPTLTGDKDGVIKVADKSKGGLSSWFNGSSAPMSLPFGDKALPPPPSSTSSRNVSPERPLGTLQRRPTVPALELGKPAKPQTSFLGGFFSSPKSPEKNIQPLPACIMDDELLTLDIHSSLMPKGTATDPFSPTAFQNLLQNAEGLLLKLQTAYKNQTLSLHEITAEKSAISEELDEAGTRAQMFRSQLEDMAARVQEQDMAIAELATELSKEKTTRAEEKEARERSISLVKSNARKLRPRSDGGEVEEDLGISNAASPTIGNKKWRGSADLSTEGESDAESGGAESVFSRSRSPTFTMHSVSHVATRDSTPEIHQAAFARMVPNNNPPSGRPKQIVQQKSTFQKIMQGISATTPTEEKDHFGGIGMGEEGCSNCRGKDASVAWDTVGLLRAENRSLKEQVSTMEDGVEGALALCQGYGLH
ncbi:hypothetical protein BJ875DRAFT_2825 [Amylocarpus encephaloides]|uniref:Uncharacterized protein n=1 Tax=Amylocarpus encephaloides TaxID=45428 RepID=A0A9P7YU99_9HELO|nr:hypothetical protein BJ875DRAFT_2825 [Amylocarpus encephaloides]